MYNDYRNTSRETWKYTYKGSELLPHAERKFQEFLAKEVDARRQMAAYMVDMKVSQSSDEVSKCKTAIETNGNLREQCAVYVHEFRRTPDRDFLLSLGDVTFFGIVPEPEGNLDANNRNH